MLIREKLPNMMRPQNLVNSLIPANSKLSKSMRPNAAQNRVCEVSHKLEMMTVNGNVITIMMSLLCKLSVGKAVIYFNHNLVFSFIHSLKLMKKFNY